MTTPMARMAAVLTCAACAAEDAVNRASYEPLGTLGTVERLDPRIDAIVPSDAVIEILAQGHEWTEGPVWVPPLQSILYSDIPNNAIYRWSEDGGSSMWLQPAGYTGDESRGGESGSNGLTLDGAGRLVLAQHGDRRIARLTATWDAPEPSFETLAAEFEGARFNSPNDVVVHSGGDFYFTDPPYGLVGGMDDPAKEMDVQGVYRLNADGSVTRLIDDLPRPNGIGFSPDERTLYVANSGGGLRVVMAYPMQADGNVGEGRVFFESSGDGLAVDQEGNVYVSGTSTGVSIIAPDGTHLGSLDPGERTSNCAFGDDGSTLYITSDMYLVRVRLTATGVGF